MIEQFCENKAKPELNCNGNCHLSKELSKQIQKNVNQEKHSLNISIYLPNAFNEIESIHIKHPKLKKEYISFYSNNYHFLGITNFLHPPQV